MRRIVILPVLILLLCGWTSKQDILKSQVPPSAKLKATLVNAARDFFVDPYSVRDAQVSSLMIIDAKKGLQAVCVRANAKNRMGAYAGRTAVSVKLKKGIPVSTRDKAPGCYLQGLRYYPFPELEAL